MIFHNLGEYDSHFIMQTIGEIANKYKYKNIKGEEKQIEIHVIPNNMTLMLGNHLTFIDSFQFMSSSLDKLVSNLSNDAFKYTSSEIKSDRKLNLIKRKGVYPYDYMDSFEKFNETELPNKDSFYNILNDEHITEYNYKHEIKVWVNTMIYI